MRLYYSPLACSLAAHIACREAGLEVELVRVDLPSKRTASGADLWVENPMGQVPTLVLDDGRTLTESVAVLAYLEDHAPRAATEGALAAPPGDRYELVRWLSFVSTELHKKVLWPIYAPGSPDAVKAHARESAARGLGVVAARLESQDTSTLVGGSFTVADAFLFWALTLMLMPGAGVSLDEYPALRAYRERHRKRPAVHAAIQYEKAEWQKPFAA